MDYRVWESHNHQTGERIDALIAISQKNKEKNKVFKEDVSERFELVNELIKTLSEGTTQAI